VHYKSDYWHKYYNLAHAICKAKPWVAWPKAMAWGLYHPEKDKRVETINM